MRELVLGGDGLIGSTVVEMLRDKGHSVASLDIKSGCDLRSVSKESFFGHDRVWFLAWDTGGAKYIEANSRQHAMYKHNCELSCRVFDILSETEQPFLFATSQLAGQPTAYGMTKLLGEKWATQIGGKIARLWNVYGWEHPDVKSHVITDLVLSAISTGAVNCMTNGQEHRRFLYKTDCAQALLALFDSSQENADIAGDAWLSIGDIAHEIACQLEVDIVLGNEKGNELIVEPEKLLPQWRPQVSLRDGISRVIRDARSYLDK